MNNFERFLVILALPAIISCSKKEMIHYPASSNLIQWQGRTMKDKAGNRQLISTLAGMKFRFAGNECKVSLKNVAPGHEYNYISIVLDGIHQEREPIHSDTFTLFEIKADTKAPKHDVELYKETEAVCGWIVINGIHADSLKLIPEVSRKKIEFIGNSITVGMSDDASRVPCGSGAWYDQHNAYEAYGPRVARALNLDYMVNGVSGIGIYRNWNTDGPVIGNVYDQAYMDPNTLSPKWDFSIFTPDIVTICLGTNDLSTGDGVTPRLPFDSIKFINTYVSFLEKIHTHYPHARILLLNSPVIGGASFEMLNTCLKSVKEKAESTIKNLSPVSIFFFKNFEGSGCVGHPSVKDHARMAAELTPYIKQMLQE